MLRAFIASQVVQGTQLGCLVHRVWDGGDGGKAGLGGIMCEMGEASEEGPAGARPAPGLCYGWSMKNFQAQNHPSGWGSGGQPTHSVRMRASMVRAKAGYSTMPADLHG